ncbi:DUF6622 family protein [Variovorax sp. WDL1]|uniref:DUF6622 family protein n=1 Tax=unclassified Variovorax TaxID=663243 RepID=UPI00076DD2BD|nr:putative transmembrane protein [Variovorax sp. WDL1]PNG47519.1 hypothetical protein CHC06_07869 [Variovorax sp. B2]PNG47830.1 hypothetical protein CHC07_06999 [Variovorax sp. B4]VTV15436.1 hypothetical protein WDL1CHR_05844 [Variovorax sp. WDL1]
MLMLTQILAHTPRWVFVLFALLVWLGLKQLRAGTVSLARVTLLPIAMIGLSFYGMLSTFGDSPAALLGWAGAATTLLLAVQRWPLPASARFDAATRTFHLPGSAAPLALMMGIFFTKYAVGVLLAMHPELARHAGFALGIGSLYGTFSGIFSARALRLWKLAIREDRVGVPAAGA